MSDFRKLLLAFASVALFAGMASAQVTPPITCSTTAQPLTVRTEGLAEQTGDILISCTGGQAPALGSVLPQVNISVTLSTNITSRLLSDPITEALLFVDDPQPGNQRPCATSGSTVCSPFYAGSNGTATITPNGADYRNVFQGVKQNDNTIVWLAVPIHAPGSTGTRLFRTKNIRAAVAGASATNGQIFAFVSIQNSTTNLLLNNSSVVVAFVQQGLDFAVRSASGGGFSADATGVRLFLCESFNTDLGGDPTKKYNSTGGRSFTVKFKERFAAAFKQRDINTALANTLSQNVPQNNPVTAVESGFYSLDAVDFPSTNGLNRAGRADSGTRLRVAFNNVPANVRIYVSTSAIPGETSSLVSAYAVADTQGTPSTIILNRTSESENVAGGNLSQYPNGFAPGLIEVPLVSGAGSFVWEVFSQDPSSIDTASFAVAIAYKSTNNPGVGKMTVNGSFAPVNSSNKMSATAPIPRFADQGIAADGAALNVCQTNLLFPFVSNQGGFDTGMAISNTSSDPYSTTPQSGNCELNYYGGTTGGGAGPSKQTTTSAVASGTQAIFTLSSGGTNGIAATPGFQGYIIAICNFRYAHGFAFISDVGAQRLSHGYLALILDPRVSNTAESLGQ